MEELLQSTERIHSQTDLRLAGQTTIPDRMVSLFDPDARPIRKGKLGRPVEFGYKVMIIDNREGLIEGYEVYKGNPVDHELLVPRSPSIRRDRLSPRRGRRRPGFRDHQSRRRPQPARGAHLRHPPTGPDTPRTQTKEAHRNFKRLVKWRTGSEGRISHWKRGYGGRRTRLKGIAGATTWVGFGVLTHNLNKISTLEAATG
jgi:IS5 family transposase